MCGWEVELPDPIHSIDTISSDSSQMCVVTHGSSVHLFQLDTNEKASEFQGVKIVQKEGRFLRPNWVRSYALNLPSYADFYHWRWVNSSIMAACSINQVVILQCKHDTIVVRYSFSYKYHFMLSLKSFSFFLLEIILKWNLLSAVW